MRSDKWMSVTSSHKSLFFFRIKRLIFPRLFLPRRRFPSPSIGVCENLVESDSSIFWTDKRGQTSRLQWSEKRIAPKKLHSEKLMAFLWLPVRRRPRGNICPADVFRYWSHLRFWHTFDVSGRTPRTFSVTTTQLYTCLRVPFYNDKNWALIIIEYRISNRYSKKVSTEIEKYPSKSLYWTSQRKHRLNLFLKNLMIFSRIFFSWFKLKSRIFTFLSFFFILSLPFFDIYLLDPRIVPGNLVWPRRREWWVCTDVPILHNVLLSQTAARSVPVDPPAYPSNDNNGNFL